MKNSNLPKFSIALLLLLLLIACASTKQGAGPANTGSGDSAPLLGTWKLDIFADGTAFFIWTFKTGGEGYSTHQVDPAYHRDAERYNRSGGAFYYSVSGSNLIHRDASGTHTMEFSITPDGNGIVIKNLLGLGIDVIGIKQ
jgi:hypothetical protein